MGFAVENMAKGASSQKYVGQKYVGAVEAAVTILRYLAGQSSPHGVAAIARATDLNISTTFNILRTLCKDDLVAFDAVQKSYRIGMGVLEFSAPLIGGNQVDVMRPVLERLAARHRVLIGLWQITADERIVLLDRVVDQGIVRADMSLGSRLPAYAGAIGRVYAASRDLSRAQLRAKFKTLRWD
ncbi:MAG: helix-turn-helix domain-containing protein, partial [Hyphomicrobiaceae bacterium]|nr:helix-turn-helix domain-containing protein [Hyphomicrobiaceae bacterium]